ncbi:hypothetical protein F511_42514 [Dorcoceras hygrometricum]|uniref:Uncharacterized protein n=1 Tax=Dorcoceras hygrometricum TaxID=472368 RepID=A0A2Z7AZR4_9LAMI|nr:hypothetical protein F511_42514 [Dorcoceras hygrometricum]
MSASGESSTTMHRLLHASGSHPIPPPNDPNSLRQSGPRPDPRFLHQAALEALTRSARTNTPRKTRPEQFPAKFVGGGGGGGGAGDGGGGVI